MNRLIVAAAGSGKTQKVVNDSLSVQGHVLITTYTDRNVEEICQRIYQEEGCVPCNITILPWYTFVLKYFVKPYQDVFYSKDINGINLTNFQSAKYVPEANTKRYYFDSEGKIYSDKISKFAVKCLDYYSKDRKSVV